MPTAEFNQDVTDPKYERYFKNIRNRILRNLGHPMVRVELMTENIHEAILEAIQKYYEYSALEYGFRIVATSGAGSVVIPDDIHPKRIVDVIFETDGDSYTFGNVGDMAQIGWGYQQPTFNDFVQDFDITKYYMYTQQIQDMKKILQIQRHWTISNNTIELFPKDNNSASKVGILYGEVPDLREIENEEWIKDFALAKCKIMLGEVREKLASASGAGGNLALNGSQLKGEGKAEVDELKTELKFRQRPLPIEQF